MGRPPTDSDAPGVKERLLAGATDVYCRHGFHGASVELILESAGVSRPTFYKLFSNKYEIIDAVVKSVGGDLLRRMKTAAGTGDDIMQRFSAVIDAYLDWGQANKGYALTIFREFYDPSSPVSVRRQHAMKNLAGIVAAYVEAEGVIGFDPLLFETLIYMIEHVAYKYFADPDASAAAVRLRYREIILHIVTTTLKLSPL